MVAQALDLVAQGHQGQAEQDGEQQHLEDVAPGEGADDAVRDDVQDEVGRLHLVGLLGELGHQGGVRRLAAEVESRMQHVAHDQADDQGEGGDDLEVEQGLDADPADRLGALDVGDARDHGAEDDGGDDHLDQVDEAVAHGS